MMEFTKKISEGVKDQKGIEGAVVAVHVGDFWVHMTSNGQAIGRRLQPEPARAAAGDDSQRPAIRDRPESPGGEPGKLQDVALAVAGGLDFSPSRDSGITPPE